MTLDSATDAGIFARSFDDFVVEIGVASGRVVGVSFPDAVPDDAATDHALLERVAAYLDGEEDHFDDVQVALTVPTAQRSVLEATRNVPYGETVSVERLARLAGLDPEDDDDRRTVETALRENPVPLFVPDHRVEGPGATPPTVARLLRAIESS
ncbi:methylated-DNA--[protein]-cysteine S-methyltransferase [Salinigranum halophilum]|uniref:methylated-DNA--[protein]-cysteine S-methyltransferase n=1 Tax=Salinigranum halophilum TaxID=2565931 RepID=UPI0010A787A1|nr:MGMT family protein [Salinigranum halophilum]